MRLHFTKMHGLGNDFVLLDALRQPFTPDADTVRRISDRQHGIGCDQVLVVERASRPDADFRYRIFNRDGGEVAQCGNGARCFARYLREAGHSLADTITVETATGLLTLIQESDGEVRVNMGVPVFEPAAIPFTADVAAARYTLGVGDEAVEIGAVALGNPHAVLRVDDVDHAPVARLGPLIESHPRFPERVNVGFLQVLARDRLRLRVYERGAGETRACGSGACAAAVIARLWGLTEARVTVQLRGGDLVIEWDDRAAPVWMKGPATRVFEGDIEL
jgi:diaminopimelate epimerase